MNDLISRQAALDALEWKWAGKAAIDAIKSLPSAQPDLQPTCNQLATDCVSRKDVIEFIHKTICGFFDIASDDSEEPISDKDKLLLEVNKVICNGIRDFPSAQSWIPVSEMLPNEVEERFLVCTNTLYMCLCRWTNRTSGKWEFHFMDIPQYTRVVAWMEAPEPYKGEEE